MQSMINRIASSRSRSSQRQSAILLILTAVLSVSFIPMACSGGGGGSDQDGTPLPRVEASRQDIDFLTAHMERIHPNLFHAITEQAFRTAATTLKNAIPALTANEIFVEIKRLVALPARQEDGHMGVRMFQATNFRFFPLRLYIFADGVFVIDANPPYEDAIGQRVVQIGGMDIDTINDLMNPLITRDNATTLLCKRTLHYVVPEILHTLGILDDVAQGDYLLEEENGARSILTVSPIDKEVYRNTIVQSVGLFEQPNPLYLSNVTERFWMQILAGSTTLYIKYNLVQPETQSGWTMTAFSALIAETVVTNSIDKVVVDVRQNDGGNALTFAPLINVLSSPNIDQPNTLYVLIGRQTFSAAANFVTVLKQRANHVIFAGEPTGGSLNNYGDTQSFDLPHSGYGIAVPTIYWDYAPGDPRLAIDPDLPVDLTSDDYFRQRDSVLEAVLND